MQPYPQQPGYPAQPGYPQQPAMPQYPVGYGYPPPPAPAPVAPGTLDTFYSQPSAGGGPSFKFMDANRQPMIGKSYSGIVARTVTDGDVRPQTDNAGKPQTYKDGRQKYVLVVPMTVAASQEFPEGVASWWCKGQARDELARAMAEAGAPTGPPEAGAAISVTLTGTRPVPGYNPQYLYRIEYRRPTGAPPAPAQAAPAPAPAPAQAAPAPAPVPAQAAPVQPMQAPPGMTPDQQKLLAQLTASQSTG